MIVWRNEFIDEASFERYVLKLNTAGRVLEHFSTEQRVILRVIQAISGRTNLQMLDAVKQALLDEIAAAKAKLG